MTGLTGAFLLATHGSISQWGFVAFLASNFFWLMFGYLTKRQWMVMMQIGFTVTSVVGISNWFHLPFL